MTLVRLAWVGPLLLAPIEMRRVPDGVPGVYLLHAFASYLGGYVTFYAGRSRNLRRRLLQHADERNAKPSISAARACDRTYWSAAPVLDMDRLAGIEAGLIRALRPICNQQVPAVVPVIVNLPPLTFAYTFCEEEMNYDEEPS